MRRAKIVCTLGPATDSYDQIKALVEAGARIVSVIPEERPLEEVYLRLLKDGP